MPRAIDGKLKRRAQAQTVRVAARTARLASGRVLAASSHPRSSVVSGLKNFTDAKITYTEQFLMTGGANVQTYAFVANGLYDPNYTATGHQPAYFDQYMALYHRYVVKKSTIRLRPIQTNYGETVATAPWYGVIIQGDGISTPSNSLSMLENLRMDKRSTDAKYACTPAQRNDEGGRSSVYANYDAVRENAKTSVHELADSHKGTASANPSTKWWFQVCCAATENGVFENTRFVAEITYHVRFHDRKIAPLS